MTGEVTHAWAEVAAALRDEGHPFHPDCVKFAFELLGPSDDAHVLVVEPDRGLLVVEAARRAAWVTAVEVDSLRLEALRARTESAGQQNVSLTCASPRKLPLKDEAFDAAVWLFPAYFPPERHTVFLELRRVLRSKGRAGFVAWGDAMEEGGTSKDLAHLGLDELVRDVGAAGLDVVGTESRSFSTTCPSVEAWAASQLERASGALRAYLELHGGHDFLVRSWSAKPPTFIGFAHAVVCAKP